jgi:hypothetical protein
VCLEINKILSKTPSNNKSLNRKIICSSNPRCDESQLNKTRDPLRGFHLLAVAQKELTISPELRRGKTKANQGNEAVAVGDQRYWGQKRLQYFIHASTCVLFYDRTPCKCVSRPNSFSYVCGYLTLKSQRRNFTPLLMTMRAPIHDILCV